MPEQRFREHGADPPSGVPVFADESSEQHAAELVRQSSLFANIAQADRIQIIAAAQERKFSSRQTLFVVGDPVRNVILLTSGFAKILQFSPNGNEVILRLSGPGEVVGTVGLCVEGCHCSMARSIDAATALVWESNVFESVSERYPVLRRNTVHILCQRLQEMEQRYREICTQKVAARLSHELVRLHSQIGRPVNGAMEIALSREELAQMTGTTLFTVSRLLCEWDQLGIVSSRRGAVSVVKLQALQELATLE